MTRLKRWYWQHRKHPHTMENEIYLGECVYGYYERNGDLLEIGGYAVECKKCGAIYAVPVG